MTTYQANKKITSNVTEERLEHKLTINPTLMSPKWRGN